MLSENSVSPAIRVIFLGPVTYGLDDELLNDLIKFPERQMIWEIPSICSPTGFYKELYQYLRQMRKYNKTMIGKLYIKDSPILKGAKVSSRQCILIC